MRTAPFIRSKNIAHIEHKMSMESNYNDFHLKPTAPPITPDIFECGIVKKELVKSFCYDIIRLFDVQPIISTPQVQENPPSCLKKTTTKRKGERKVTISQTPIIYNIVSTPTPTNNIVNNYVNTKEEVTKPKEEKKGPSNLQIITGGAVIAATIPVVCKSISSDWNKKKAIEKIEEDCQEIKKQLIPVAVLNEGREKMLNNILFNWDKVKMSVASEVANNGITKVAGGCCSIGVAVGIMVASPFVIASNLILGGALAGYYIFSTATSEPLYAYEKQQLVHYSRKLLDELELLAGLN